MTIKKKNKLNLGLAQFNPTVGDFEGNSERIVAFIEKAEEKGVELLIFPELAVSGYPVWDLANKSKFVEANLKSIDCLAKATKNKNVAVAVGYIDKTAKTTQQKEKSLNAIAVLRDGKVIHKQYKTLLPNYDVFLEEIFFARETKHNTFLFNGISFGTTICEDIWDDHYSIKPASILAKKGARILINISASPYHRKAEMVRDELLRRKAREYRVWIVYVNQVGGQDDLIFDGQSSIYTPEGKRCFKADAFQEGLFRFELDLDSTQTTDLPVHEKDEVRNMYEALCMGLKDYVRKNGFKRVTVGLSGGIDSALVATLARDALGAQAVIGVGMPGPYSSEGSLVDAKALAKNLGIEFRTRPISPLYNKFVQETTSEKESRDIKSVEKSSITLALENLQARLRGLELMYLSNDEGVLLLSTGNKSELAMGYCTLYGDMCGGLSVLGDVYKTDVYRLVQYRNSISRAIPQATIDKPPSAELRPNQKDEDSLPPYSALDQVLYQYIEKNESFDQIARHIPAKTISRERLRQILKAVDHNEYKRRQLPPLLRVTEKAWFGRRMPITNHFEI
jgi:NAD+ synthase (glutamine-hydrolysing)